MGVIKEGEEEVGAVIRDSLIFLGSLTAFVAVNLSPLTWFFRKSDYGSLLLDVGQIEKSKFWWRIGTVIALFIILFFKLIGTGLNILNVEIFPAYLTPVFYLIATGLAHIELREKGICYRFKLIRWRDIKSCKWELNLLTIKFKRNGELSLLIPIDYRDAVNHILAEHLPENDLSF
jgi:uncharacterized membrane protein YhaH (DUF805 family)